MLHRTIKDQIKDAMRAKDALRLETLRGLNALAMNELLARKSSDEFLPDDAMSALVKKSVKQRKDSIEQFEKDGRNDLAAKEKAELAILESFMPKMMSREEVRVAAQARIEALKAAGTLDPKSGGKVTGMIMKELAGKADGSDVKAVVEELLTKGV